VSKADRSAVSRPSKNNRQEGSEGYERPDFVDPSDLPGDTGLRPVSVEPGRTLRSEAVLDSSEGPQARPWYAVVNEWREWYADYRSMHVEYEGPDGETSRTRLENSYQPEYGKRYYAKLKDLERGIEREFESLTTAMLTFSASSLNAEGMPRCPADHMREIAAGWDTCRKQLHQVLSGRNWEYAKVWEPHPGGERSAGGYGHMHVAVFVEADDLEADEFRPVMESYVANTKPAGREVHTVDEAVSVNNEVENLGSYISEYVGIFGKETLERPMTEQMFYAMTWATQTRRLDFSNGAQDIINGEQFRRETGLRPEDRGRTEGNAEAAESDESEEQSTEVSVDPEGESVEREQDDGGGWKVDSICRVTSSEGPEYMDPTTGGVDAVAIEGRPGVDPPREVD
jgi:hypothetical protein